MSLKTSIVEVAADAGVSVTTVSHALSGRRAVSAATQAKVRASVDRLGYRPNVLAQGLRHQRTHTVGLIIADITNPYYPAVARAVHDELRSHGLLPFIGNTDGDRATEVSFLQEMVARRVDGIIIQPLALSAVEVVELVGESLPLVIGSNDAADLPVDLVSTDDAVGIAEAVQHLCERGHHRIGYLSGPEHLGPGDSRLAGFRVAIAAAGLAVEERGIRRSPFTRDGGLRVATAWLAEDDLPDALRCANDLIAIGVLDAARSAGLSVPGDLAVIGFDDIETADLVSPRLTTVLNPAGAMGAAYARALLRRLQTGPSHEVRHEVLPTRLVVRESA